MKYISPRPMLALLLLIFANLACYVPSQIVKGDITCKHVAYNPLSGGHLYSCTCPLDTSNMTFSEIYAKDLNTITDQEVKNRACSNYSANTESNESQPTEAPTEEPGSTEPPADPAPLKPFLTEEFTTCDNAAGYVNFSIAEDAPAYDPATFKVTFNGYPVSCEPSANNPSVFTCKYPPASYAPPAGVQVFIGEELVNEFDFNGGAICDPASQPNNPDPDPTEDPNNPAAPTEDPGGSG